MYKIIIVDNYDRDYIPHKLLVDNLTEEQADKIVKELNKYIIGHSNYYISVKQEYPLKTVEY